MAISRFKFEGTKRNRLENFTGKICSIFYQHDNKFWTNDQII